MNIVSEVCDMNQAFGYPKGKFDELSHSDWDSLFTQISCITEEVNETLKAIGMMDKKELVDGICDILVFAIGAAHKAGIDLEKAMHAVYESNMSKFIINETDEIASIKKYAELGVEMAVRGEYPRKVIYSTKNQTDENGKFWPCNKFAKSVSFKEPNLL
jgi:NTP pyrophosphatase (non-canonical NTP hydrolase)